MLKGLPWKVAALILAAAPAAAQSPEVQRQLVEAGRLFERGQSWEQSGELGAALDAYRRAVAQVDSAFAASPDPAPDLVFGRREMQLTLADAYLAADRPREALDLLRSMADEQADAAAPAADRGARLHLARTLRAMVGAAFRAGAHVEGREALARLVVLGRSMQADEPANAYLARTLAHDLENETFIRFILGDGDGSRAAANETLALFRALAEASPDSEEARRSHFLWAWFAAELQDDPALLEEAVRAGEWLETRGALPPEQRGYLVRARERLAG